MSRRVLRVDIPCQIWTWIGKVCAPPMHAQRAGIGSSTYFAGFSFAGTSTFSTCRRICVPESRWTFSVFETITGPGVRGLGTELRLRPLSPVMPCGIPTLIGLPFGTVSGTPAELATRGRSRLLDCHWSLGCDRGKACRSSTAALATPARRRSVIAPSRHGSAWSCS